MPISWERRSEALKAIRDAKVFGPDEVWLGYNANGDLVEIRKQIDGTWYTRPVRLDGVTDFVVATWDKFEGWTEVP